MFEKLIENWLINVHELGYQLPFCEVLLLNGFKVLHVSRHGRGEHGVDVVARTEDGQLTAYQLKCGDIRLPDWRRMREEVAELVQLQINHPGIRKNEAHIPYLVTNGEILGDAVPNIDAYASTWGEQGFRRLRIIQRRELQSMFVKAHCSYLPVELRDFREFVELFIADFEDRLERGRFAHFLFKLAANSNLKGRKRLKRLVESTVLMGSYIVEQYERAGNFVSALEGWTIIAATLIWLVTTRKIRQLDYQTSLDLVWTGLERNLLNFERDISEREDLIEMRLLEVDTDNVRGARTALALGWLAATELVRSTVDIPPCDKIRIATIAKRELGHFRAGGESVWPIIATLAVYLENMGFSEIAESLLVSWVDQIDRANHGSDPAGIPNPYWLEEDTLALHYDQLPGYKREYFAGQSYSAESALDMLVRRMRRRAVRMYWPSISRLQFCNYLPDSDDEWFLWSSSRGELQIVHSTQPRSWRSWRNETAVISKQSIPTFFLDNPKWILPFVLTYPHRTNRAMSALIDCIFGGRAELQ